tara:strand:- start:122 stop:316 length:195 start_codon:yes stop_codon:yes gene_type:complete
MSDKSPILFAFVDGKIRHTPGDNRKEAEDLLKLSRWLCGEKPPRIQWPPESPIAKTEQLTTPPA